MYPKIFSFWLFGKEFVVYTYGTAIVIAFLIAAWWTRKAATKTLSLDKERVFNVGFALLFVGIAGARLLYVFGKYDYYAARPMEFLYIWQGGLNGYGGLVAGLLWLWWWLPRHPDMKGFAFFDVLSRGFLLAFAFGWIAPLLAGDDFGKPTSLPWGVPVSWFQEKTPAASWGALNDPLARLHPTQVYEALFALAAFFVVGALAKRGWRSGRVAAAVLMIHSVGHAVIDAFRGDGSGETSRGMIVPDVLSVGQLIAIGVFFAGLALWVIRSPERRTASAPAR